LWLKFGEAAITSDTTFEHWRQQPADLQLLSAALVWVWALHVSGTGLTTEVLASIVSLSGGALLANFISVILLVAETITIRR
jgi:hypothetical protein